MAATSTDTTAADASHGAHADVLRRDASPLLRLSIVVALASVAGSLLGLIDYGRYYGGEAEVFINQAIAQDLVNLAIVAPLTVALALRALRGSTSAYLLWLGFVGFTVYNYMIYAFAVHFGPLFLLWVAVLGASAFTLVGGATAVDAGAVAEAMRYRSRRVASVFLMVVAAMFAVMWLGDIVPPMVAGDTPDAVSELALPTNPVHVLDLAFLLPATALAGWGLWHRHPLSYAAAPPIFVLLALTGLPILTTVFVTAARGQDPAWPLLAPIGILTVASFVGARTSVRAPSPPAECTPGGRQRPPSAHPVDANARRVQALRSRDAG